MTEYSAKKLGEVLAFATVGEETLRRGRAALGEPFEGYIEQIEKLAGEIEHAGREENVGDIVLAKSEKTASKLRSMQELYLQDPADWEDPAELCEWLGFFVGAAIVHWELVLGVAEKTQNSNLSTLSKGALGVYKDIFGRVSQTLSSIGSAKA